MPWVGREMGQQGWVSYIIGRQVCSGVACCSAAVMLWCVLHTAWCCAFVLLRLRLTSGLPQAVRLCHRSASPAATWPAAGKRW